MEASRIFRGYLFAMTVLVSLGAMPTRANAFASVFGAPSAAASLATLAGTGAGAVGAAVVAEAAADGAGKYVVAGAIVLLVVDPVEATYYNGAFAINFAPDMLNPIYSGWLGSWGDTPANPAPPVNPSGTFPVGTTFNIHGPNPALTASVVNDVVNGIQTVTFDWGPSGHAQSDVGHFNFYAAAFQAKQDLIIKNLGAGAAPLAGANLYTSNLGVSCSAAGSSVLSQCGSETSHSFTTTAVPEVETWQLALVGVGVLGGVTRRRRIP